MTMDQNFDDVNQDNLELSPNEALEKFRGNSAVFVDVREAPEWESGCVPSSFRLPLSLLASGRSAESSVFATLDALDAPIIVYCHGGVRSLTGAVVLRKMLRRDDVQSMSGGIIAWSGELEVPTT